MYMEDVFFLHVPSHCPSYTRLLTEKKLASYGVLFVIKPLYFVTLVIPVYNLGTVLLLVRNPY